MGRMQLANSDRPPAARTGTSATTCCRCTFALVPYPTQAERPPREIVLKREEEREFYPVLNLGGTLSEPLPRRLPVGMHSERAFTISFRANSRRDDVVLDCRRESGPDRPGPAGLLRGDAPAPPHHPSLSVRSPLLHLLLDALGGPGAADATEQAAPSLPELLRSALRAGADGHVGGRADPRLCPVAMVARLGTAHPRGRRRLSRLSLFQWGYLLYARLRRRHAGPPPGALLSGRRDGPWVRIPRRCYQLPAGALSGVLPSRADHRALGCPSGLAADRRSIADPARPAPQLCSARPLPGGMGAVGGRGARKSYLLPGPELLPLAARQPILAGGADGDPGHRGAGDRGGQGCGPVPGAVDLRHRAAYGRGPGPGLSCPPDRSGPGSLARGPMAAAAGGVTGGGD